MQVTTQMSKEANGKLTKNDFGPFFLYVESCAQGRGVGATRVAAAGPCPKEEEG